jgi:type VI secretion system protein ImpD
MNEAGSVLKDVDAPDAGGRGPVVLREMLVGAVLGGVDRLDDALSDFLTGEATGTGLLTWFGDKASEWARHGDVAAFRQFIDRDIAAIDQLIGELLDTVLHHKDFKRIEASWRGVDYLLDQIESEEKVKVRLFNATWIELSRDFDRAIEFDQSALFAKVYNDEYGMAGGLPYGLLLCDYAIRHRFLPGAEQSTDDVSTLGGLAQVAAASFAPCVISAAPELFGVPTFADLSHIQNLDAGFRLAEYQRWRRLQEQEDSRFLGVVLPRVLLRDKYEDSPSREDGFRYREAGNGIDSWLWGNAVYGFGAVAIRAFHDSGWFADVRGAYPDRDEAGVLTGLPAPYFSTGEAVAYRRPLEVELTDRKQRALEDLGFIALSPCSFTKSTVFLGIQSLHVAGDIGNPVERINSRLSSMLQYVMCVSRFAHYAKVMARDRVGAFTSAADLQKYLNDWLRGYMLGNADAGAELKARYPLSGGGIEVKEIPGRPGTMSCVIHLQPHFQFDQMVSGFKRRTELQAAYPV